MNYKLCEFVKYTGHRPSFIQSVDRQKYGFNDENGFVCHVPNPEHMILLIKRVAQLVPVMPGVEVKEREAPPVAPKAETKQESRPIKKEKRHGRKG